MSTRERVYWYQPAYPTRGSDAVVVAQPLILAPCGDARTWYMAVDLRTHYSRPPMRLRVEYQLPVWRYSGEVLQWLPDDRAVVAPDEPPVLEPEGNTPPGTTMAPWPLPIQYLPIASLFHAPVHARNKG